LLEHDAFTYRDQDEFLGGALPFVRESIELGEPVAAAPTERNASLLQRELGADADKVEWAPSPESHKPLDRLMLFDRFISRHLSQGAQRVRLLGEPAWPRDSEAGVAEWKRYESYLNIALGSYPVWLVCPYDASTLSADIVSDSCRTHPYTGHGDERSRNASYVDPRMFWEQLDGERPLPPAPQSAVAHEFASAHDARGFVAGEAARAGFPRARVLDAKLAASEVVTNVFRYAGGRATVRTWIDDPYFVFDVSDPGPGIEEPFPGYKLLDPREPRGFGLPIVRLLCDVVEMRSGSGTTVRMHLKLD
jgi:anti-sigma regulatory factor (Ser/Thr protein kinase)